MLRWIWWFMLIFETIPHIPCRVIFYVLIHYFICLFMELRVVYLIEEAFVLDDSWLFKMNFENKIFFTWQKSQEKMGNQRGACAGKCGSYLTPMKEVCLLSVGLRREGLGTFDSCAPNKPQRKTLQTLREKWHVIDTMWAAIGAPQFNSYILWYASGLSCLWAPTDLHRYVSYYNMTALGKNISPCNLLSDGGIRCRQRLCWRTAAFCELSEV